MRRCAMFLPIAAVFVQGDVLTSASDLIVSGDARFSKGFVRLTRSKKYQGGALWLSSRQQVAGGFDSSFKFEFTEQGGLGNGADGLAFVIQNSGPRAVGGLGSAGGFAVGDGSGGGNRSGIPFSLAVFFDSFYNVEIRDPSDNALHVCINGKPDELRWPPSRLAVVPQLAVKLKDGRRHAARVLYKPPVLSVYLDGELLVQTPTDLSLVADTAGKAWVGFTASTGGGYENHDLLSWDWSSSAESTISMVESTIWFVLKECLPGRNLCTPEDAIVEQKAPGVYHVILPAHLEWGASIPNPAGRTAEIVDAHGLVCWDAARGSEGCGGPAEVLMSRTSAGRLQFNVRDNAGNYADNQGFLEFDVRLK